MPDPAFTPLLKDLGIYGYVISTLVTACGALAAGNVIQWRQAIKVTKERISERDLLRDALNSAVQAINGFTRVSEQRNEVTEELASTISGWSASNEVIKERMSNQHDANTEKLRDIKFVVESLAEAVRTLTGMITDIRNSMQPRRTR